MRVDLRMLSAQIVGMIAVFGLALFGAAGTVAWPAGWTFLGLFFGFTVALSGWLLRHNPDLLTERMTGVGKADQKPWDRVWFALTGTLFLGWLVVMPLDAVRFGWSRVVDTGPYRVVRHPMYAAAGVLLTGSSLLLGSWLGLVGAAAIVVSAAFRAAGEERVLRRELPGYDAYTKKVRYRLLPYVW